MSTKLINDYWNGGSSSVNSHELLTELVHSLNGITYTQTCTTTDGRTYKKLIIEYEDTSDN
jgi:hypothetical protein